jgi:hypothetical protein
VVKNVRNCAGVFFHDFTCDSLLSRLSTSRTWQPLAMLLILEVSPCPLMLSSSSESPIEAVQLAQSVWARLLST